MWGDVTNVKEWLERAIAFTSDHELYGSYMFKVIAEWPVSCENALTDSFINQRAWIGHAASALAMNCPEHITRKAWKYLSDEQQFLANKQAERAIQSWKNLYFESRKLHTGMGGTLL